ncbi:hypothetical protein [Kitasatospora sp. NPDC088134]|uniref:hypothetical protein n=1 Tax=Kitasatospora sp. NPDC088134 TaxID=3364071 RepID=UPI00380FA936
MEKITVPEEPRWPGYPAGRWAALAALAVLVAGLGLAMGLLRHAGLTAGAGSLGTAALLVLAAGASGWAQQLARGARSWTYRPPIGRWTASLGAVALFAAGAAAGGIGRPAVAVALAAAGPAVATGRTDRRNRLEWLTAEREDALRRVRILEKGETARGTVVEVPEFPGGPDDEGPYFTQLTFRYTTAAGTEHTARRHGGFPTRRPPRVGLGVTVRFLPEDPTDTEVEFDTPERLDPTPPRDTVPAPPPSDAPRSPTLPAQLEHLHHLHLDGALTAEEFALAKRKLIAPPD